MLAWPTDTVLYVLGDLGVLVDVFSELTGASRVAAYRNNAGHTAVFSPETKENPRALSLLKLDDFSMRDLANLGCPVRVVEDLPVEALLEFIYKLMVRACDAETEVRAMRSFCGASCAREE